MKPLHECIYIYLFLRFDADHPGTVFVKNDAEAEEVSFRVLLPNTTFPDGEAPTIDPPGLPLPRQQYLYKSIREFVDDPYKDIVCPRPNVMPPDNSDDEGMNNCNIGRGRGQPRARGRGKPRARGQNNP